MVHDGKTARDCAKQYNQAKCAAILEAPGKQLVRRLAPPKIEFVEQNQYELTSQLDIAASQSDKSICAITHAHTDTDLSHFTSRIRHKKNATVRTSCRPN